MDIERLAEEYRRVLKTPVGAPLTHPAMHAVLIQAIIDREFVKLDDPSLEQH